MQHIEAAIAEDFARIRETQIENVMGLLERSFRRLKMVLILPRMTSDFDQVVPILQKTLYKPAIDMLKKLRTLDVAKIQTFNSEVLNIIYYFLTHSHMIALFPRYLNNLSADDKKLIVAFETIINVARRHLNRTSKEEINMERQLFNVYHHEEATKAKIEEIKKELKHRNIVLRWKQGAKFLVLEKRENDLASRKWKNSVLIQSEIKKRNHIQHEEHKNFLIRKVELEEQLETFREEYEKVIADIARQEKEIRAEKNKLLIQIQLIVQKYDTNIRDKRSENLELEDRYREAKKELDDFMVYYRKEEAIYKKVVLQYEQEERRKQQERILIFMINRAARIIQQYWLQWRKDQKAKARKAKKGKKK